MRLNMPPSRQKATSAETTHHLAMHDTLSDGHFNTAVNFIMNNFMWSLPLERPCRSRLLKHSQPSPRQAASDLNSVCMAADGRQVVPILRPGMGSLPFGMALQLHASQQLPSAVREPTSVPIGAELYELHYILSGSGEVCSWTHHHYHVVRACGRWQQVKAQLKPNRHCTADGLPSTVAAIVLLTPVGNISLSMLRFYGSLFNSCSSLASHCTIKRDQL